MKFVVLALLAIAVGWQLWRRMAMAVRGARSPQRTNATSEPMVRCEACAIHVPLSQATVVAGRHYCCRAHAGSSARSAAQG